MSDDYSLGTYSKLAETAEKKQQPTPPQPVSIAQTQKMNDDTKKPTMIPSNHDTTTDSSSDYIEIVRKAVKQLGEKAATHRYTANEKEAIADIVYALKKKGIHTTENEISRISINYLVWEHQQNKHTSILSRVLERLNA